MARNLDRLSLDADHIARQEAQRRRAPDRVTDGLMQGLSGFGISLLGKGLHLLQNTSVEPCYNTGIRK